MADYNEKHGGAGALKKVTRGIEFSGIAAAKEFEVRADYETQGPGAVILRNAVRLQVVSELYYDAIAKAAQDHDQAKLESALKVWGWVTNSSVRAWDLVRREMKGSDQAAMTKTVLDAIKAAQNDPE